MSKDKMHTPSLLIVGSAIGVIAASIDDCPGYTASNVVDSNGQLTADLTLAGTACSIYGTDITDLKLLVEYQTETRLHVKIYDAVEQVYQIQDSVLPRPSSQGVSAVDSTIQFNLTESPFSFSVSRSDTGDILFNTNSSKLIFESQFIYLRTDLPSDPNLYGLMEHADTFRLPTSDYQRTLWAVDGAYIPPNTNLYGAHPNYLEHRGANGSHGVALLNANGMDININQTTSGDQFLEYNIIGGVFDFYFLAGPKPADVTRQYAEVVGLPTMYSYWTFGFHQCKYGWPNVTWLEGVIANYSAADIPLEVMWTDIDYMDQYQDFTLDPVNFPLDKMRELVQGLHDRDQKYIMIQDPSIHRVDNYSSYTRGEEAGAFIKAVDGSDYLTIQWAGEVAVPDYLGPNTSAWWTNEFAIFYDPDTGIDIDGAWNDENEMSTFCADVTCDPSSAGSIGIAPIKPRKDAGAHSSEFPRDFDTRGIRSAQKAIRADNSSTGNMKGLPGRNLFTPEYAINNSKGALSNGAIYTNNTNGDGTVQYDTHNLYGLTMMTATREAMLARRPASRPFVLSRSTFAGSGNRGAHWFGDNNSTWDNYRKTIPQLLAGAAVHAMSMVGSDVCGFNGDAEEHMCARWAMLGAFQPFYRNHANNASPDQEYYLWASVTAAAQKAIDARYRLLDYFYTAMYRASQAGDPVVNPLFYIYPSDTATFGIQTQWFYGDAVLVSPVIEDEATSVTFYLPDDIFYDFWTLEPVRGNASNVTVDNLDWTDIPVHIRGGTIIPFRSASANTTNEVRRNNFTIVVAPGTDGTAMGSLYLDDGDSLDVGSQFSDISFSWDGTTLSSNGTFGYQADVVIGSVQVLGGDAPVTKNGSWSLNQAFELTISS
ncbi:glycoside hydrolase family 31 protein [Xylariaceae sp. FL0255]|nr:glycoside hydrolase family 31 protein [Xylariaceae sp. FL0255]